MRILKTTQSYFPYLSKGGPPAKVRAIAKALVRRGHEVTVLTAIHQGQEAGGRRQEAGVGGRRQEQEAGAFTQGKWGLEARDEGVEAVYLRTLHNYRATTINPQLISFCARRLKHFDVVHVYGLYDLIGSVTAWCCRRRGIPYVLEPLGMFGPKVRSQQKKRLYDKLVGNALFSGAQIVVATSETERAELIDGGVPAEKIVLRRNGIELTEFENLPARGSLRARLTLSDTAPLVLFLGRISFIKGLDLLVEAFARLPEAQRGVRLVIAGPDDDDGCAAAIAESIAKLQIGERVAVIGPLYGNERLQAFVDADVLVLPSRYESFGNVAAEAIACGTPALVTDQCGIAPLIKDRAALEVSADVDGLKNGLARLLEDGSLLADLRAGCAGVAQGLSWDEPVETMERLYEKLRFDSQVSSLTQAGRTRNPKPETRNLS